MNLNRSGLLAKIYFLAHWITQSFMHRDMIDDPVRSDICSLVRTIFITAPLAIAINVATIGWCMFAVSYFLFALFYQATAVGIFFIFVAACAMLGFTMYGATRLAKALKEAETTREIAETCATYYRAKKSLICPLITFNGDNP